MLIISRLHYANGKSKARCRHIDLPNMYYAVLCNLLIHSVFFFSLFFSLSLSALLKRWVIIEFLSMIPLIILLATEIQDFHTLELVWCCYCRKFSIRFGCTKLNWRKYSFENIDIFKRGEEKVTHLFLETHRFGCKAKRYWNQCATGQFSMVQVLNQLTRYFRFRLNLPVVCCVCVSVFALRTPTLPFALIYIYWAKSYFDLPSFYH